MLAQRPQGLDGPTFGTDARTFPTLRHMALHVREQSVGWKHFVTLHTQKGRIRPAPLQKLGTTGEFLGNYFVLPGQVHHELLREFEILKTVEACEDAMDLLGMAEIGWEVQFLCTKCTFGLHFLRISARFFRLLHGHPDRGVLGRRSSTTDDGSLLEGIQLDQVWSLRMQLEK